MIATATREAIADSAGRPMVCRWCGVKAEVNRRLRISFCPVHGLESPLDPADLPPVRRLRAEVVREPLMSLGAGSWAIPAG